jgi:hypothetical protein
LGFNFSPPALRSGRAAKKNIKKMIKQEVINFEQAAATAAAVAAATAAAATAANGAAAITAATATITLVKEGLFWRAYDQSAYLLTRLFWHGLKVNGSFVKALGRELFYVGFPDVSLQAKVLDKLPEVPGSRLLTREDKKIVIDGLPLIDGFEGWKQAYLVLRAQANEQMQPFYGKLPLYKAVYDFFQEMVNLTRHFPKDLHYTLGDKIIEHVMTMNTCLYRTLHLSKDAAGYAEAKSENIVRIGELLNTVRFLLRTSFDMKLYNVERFAGISAKIDSIGKQLAGWKKSR